VYIGVVVVVIRKNQPDLEEYRWDFILLGRVLPNEKDGSLLMLFLLLLVSIMVGLDRLRMLAPALGSSLTEFEKEKEARVLLGLLGKRRLTIELSLLLLRSLGRLVTIMDERLQ
jgi:hypothetical protein